MNPFSSPYIKPFNIADYTPKKGTPQMSRLQPAQSKITDTAASSQQRYNQMFAAQPTAAKTTAKAPTVSTPKAPSTSGSTKKTSTKVEKTPEQKYQEDVRREIENAYRAQVDFLTGQEQRLQAQLPDFLKTISSPFEQQQPLLEQQLQAQQTKAAAEQEGLRMQEQQGLAGVRRTAEEAGLRAVQQFGGVGGSSAAQAAGELIGREQLRQAGSIQQQRAQGVQNINDQLRAIQGEYNANVAKLQLQKEQALSNARLTFQQEIDKIRREKMTAGVTKAQMTIEALGNFAASRQLIERDAQTQANNLAILREQAALNAQNISLQQSITGQTIQPLQFGTSSFFKGATSNQSNELAKVLQAGLTAGTIKPFGKTNEGIDLFVDNQGQVVDIRGNKYEQPL